MKKTILIIENAIAPLALGYLAFHGLVWMERGFKIAGF